MGKRGVYSHGQSSTPLYQAWKNMKKRSTPGPSQEKSWPRYVGVGRDPRWDEFEEFFKDMGSTYFPHAQLARYGDSGDYTPTNCRWITKSENSKEAASKPRKATTPPRNLG